LEESTKGIVKEVAHLPTESFTETEMLLLEQICATFRDREQNYGIVIAY
jgi:hypothetical protein